MRDDFQLLQRWLVFSTSGFALLLVLALAGYTWNDRELSMREIDNQLENRALAFAEYAEATLRAANVALEATEKQLRSHGGIATLNEKALHDLFVTQLAVFTSQVANVPIHALFVLDKQGIMRSSSVEFPSKYIDASDREYFKFHRDHNDQIAALSPLVVSKVTGLQVIYLTLRLNDGQGEFAGVLGISLRVKNFDEYYERLGLAAGQTLTIFRRDGMPIYRYPAIPDFDKTDIKKSPNLERFAKPGGGHLISISPVDGQLRRIGYRSGRQYPLIAIVSLPQSAALAGWSRNAWVIGMVGLSSLAGLFLLFLFARRQLQRAEASNKEKMQAVHERDDARQQLIQIERLDALGHMVAIFAHDIGNPIGNGMTTVSTLADRTREFRAELAEGKLRRTALDDYLTNAETGTRLLTANLERARNLLNNFKQSAMDHAAPTHREIDLSEWLHELLDSLHPLFVGSTIELAVEAPAQLHLSTLPGPLGQVITNLVSNARLHAFAPDVAGTITVRAEQRDDRLALTVSDDGKGIPSEVMTRMFEAFFTTRSNQGGTGLGLHIVKTLVEGPLGGRITVDSKLGQGTTFNISLPLSGAETKPPP